MEWTVERFLHYLPQPGHKPGEGGHYSGRMRDYGEEKEVRVLTQQEQ